MTGAQDVWRRETPHVLAALIHRYGGIQDCEDAAQEALLAAAAQWPREGVPDNPRGWLVRVASRRLVDQRRSESARRRREVADALLDGTDRIAGPVSPDPSDPAATVLDGTAADGDDTLRLLVLCCHPALSRASQVALMLRAVAGLTTAQVAAGLLVPEATAAQRISRAKATLVAHGARFELPAPAELPVRLVAVRHAVALLHTEGHTRSSGGSLTDPGFSAEAISVAGQLHEAAPADPENAGLLALLLLTHARAAARVDDRGDLVPLEHQDRARWDGAAIARGVALLEACLPGGPVGEFQLQAAIAAVHAEAPTWAATDWPQIAELYRMLDRVAPSEAVTIGRATAVAMVAGPDAGLALLTPLAGTGAVHRNHRYHAVRGHLLEVAGRLAEARDAYAEAARLTRSIPEQRYLNRRAAAVQHD